MKKIAFLGGLKPGGSEHQMVIIACLLKREGYDVTYFTAKSCGFYRKELENVGIPIIALNESRFANFFKLNILFTLIKLAVSFSNNKYSTVISFLGEWNFYNCFLASNRFTRHRAITGIRNNRDDVFLSTRSRLFNKFECYSYLKVSNSISAKEKFASLFPNLSNKLKTIYNIVELPTISSIYTPKQGGRVSIIVPASYRAVKNPMNLLRALTLLPEKECSLIKIHWYGNINGGLICYNEMKSYIQEHKLEDVIELHDVTSDIANKINEVDFIGLFSTSEGLPNAVCEGMMLGKPVVMTKVSDYEVLAGNGNGFLCEAYCPESIATSLSMIANISDTDLAMMGKKSKEIAMNLFSVEKILKQWKQII